MNRVSREWVGSTYYCNCWATVSCWKKYHMTHRIIFLTKFLMIAQLLFWRNFVRYIHAILFPEHNKWNSVWIGNQSCFWLKHLFWLYPIKKGEQRGGLKCFLAFSVQLSWITVPAERHVQRCRPLDTSERLMDVSSCIKCVIQQSLKARCINKTQFDSTENYLLSICSSVAQVLGKERWIDQVLYHRTHPLMFYRR